MTGRVFSVEEFSTFDGPGVRTTVFFKGCPMRCTWCHNPEGQRFENEFVRSPNGCLHCGACLLAGEKVTGERILVKESIAVCPRNLVRECAVDYTPEELCARLLKNAALLNRSGGGVTFSGGEPLSQYEFLLECLSLLRGKIHCAVQTSGFCDSARFEEMLQHVDYVLYDLKIIDEKMHNAFTGCSNRDILRNFKTLCQSGVPFCVRTPLIPTVTDTKDNLEAIARLLLENGRDKIEVLPYNKMAGAKYQMVGRQYGPGFDASVPVQARPEIFEQYGIDVKVL